MANVAPNRLVIILVGIVAMGPLFFILSLKHADRDDVNNRTFLTSEHLQLVMIHFLLAFINLVLLLISFKISTLDQINPVRAFYSLVLSFLMPRLRRIVIRH